jgi:cupin fold WbuC family metalloprotein
MRIIDEDLLDAVSTAAKGSSRLRKNLNIHADYDEPCQRLLNAVEPGSYIRPHRHLTPPKPETFVALRGRFAALTFGDRGEIERVVPFGAGGAAAGVDIPAGAWHAIVSLESGSVFFETKPGPYVPLSDKDWAPWAPAEGTSEAADYLSKMREAVQEFIDCQ